MGSSIGADQLERQLADRLAPLYLVHGDEPLLIVEAGDAIRAAARARGYGEREVLIAGPNFRWSTLFEAASNLSLFGGDKLIDLRLPSAKPGREGGEVLTRYAKQLPPGVVTLITLPELDWATRKASWFVSLAGVATVVEANAPPLERLPAWIRQRLARQGQRVDDETARFIAERVEGNLLAAQQEIMKLGLLHPPGQLSVQDVRAAVLDVARFDIDDLQQAVLAGDLGRCARVLDGLRDEGEALPLVLWALASVARALAAVTQTRVSGQDAKAALEAQRIYGARQTAFRTAAQRLEAAHAFGALRRAARIDRIIKGVAPGDAWDECLQLCRTLCRQE